MEIYSTGRAVFRRNQSKADIAEETMNYLDYKDYYNEGKIKNYSGQTWRFLGHEIKDVSVGIFRILLNASVFFAFIAFMSAVILLAISAGGGASSQKLQEAKKWLIRIFIISILIFGVTSIINFVGNTGLDVHAASGV